MLIPTGYLRDLNYFKSYEAYGYYYSDLLACESIFNKTY